MDQLTDGTQAFLLASKSSFDFELEYPYYIAMTQINPIRPYQVDIIEYERGWGSRLDESIYFNDEQEAKDYADDYNKKYNTESKVPDWYMVARYVGKTS